MAQTIKIKRSNSSVVPSADLAHGELAYGIGNGGTGTDGKLSIGRPGTAANSMVNDVIGGRYYTVAIDNATHVNSANTLVKRTTDNSFSSGKITIESGGIQVDAHGASGTTAGTSNNWNTAYTVANAALPKAGGTLTGELKGTSASFSGAPVLNDSSINVGFNSGNAEIKAKGATGSLSSHMDLYTTNSSGSTGLKLRILAGGGLSVGTGTVTMDGAIEGVHALSMSGALTGATTIAASTSVTSPNFLGNATTATTATNVTLSADNSTNASHYIPFANSATGNQGLQTDSALSYNPSTNGLSVGTSGNIATGTLTVGSSIHGPSTFYIDPAPDDTSEVGGSTTDTGTVVILGDLRVTGTTTTINSNTVEIGDNELVLNSDHTGTPTQDAGLRVERGSASDAFFNWDESEDAWVVGEGQSSSPYFYTLLHSNNFETAYSGNIEGGTF
tara:strand:+ start:1438 stop:2775 length:1338 start_codon:yes stop_codon:yes gene_type:complete